MNENFSNPFEALAEFFDDVPVVTFEERAV
jgi:hypothetical protein